MQEELSKSKTEFVLKNIRDKFRPVTIRDLKAGRGKWDDYYFNVEDSKERNLSSDSMIDKITSLYGFVIKTNFDLRRHKVI